ncbi:MAG: filamentous hemagglutinin N-terminal domain-containing protein [Candidatus Omnitrophota bacterium]|nr:filamentous hemagglutinin N-terminal domain-containing protein [Candidatus Omnitrophota bacterium]
MKTKTLFLTILLFITMNSASVFALPQDMVVENGEVSVETPDAFTMNITASDKAIINFFSFNIGQNETVNFIQPSSSASVLSRVTGNDPSVIAGNLSAMGILFLINPNGINFTPTANIQVNSLVASTLDIANNNFINGNYELMRGDSQYSRILNEGVITGDNIALIASAVENRGIITASAGTVHLVSGDRAAVAFDSRGLVSVEVTEATSGSVIDEDGNTIADAVRNSGTIEAHRVYMTARTAQGIFENAVNNTGIVRAVRLVNEDGIIKVRAEGSVRLTGTMESEGDIEVDSSATVNIDTPITASNLISLKGCNIYSVGVNAPNVSIYKTTDTMYIENVTADGDYINIEGDGINVTYLRAANVTLRSNGLIDTSPGAILNANTLTLIADRFGSNAFPLYVNAENLTLRKLTGSFNILDSIGIGDSIFMTGPPDEDSLNIVYNRGCNLTLDADNVYVVGSDPTHFYGDITFTNLSCIIPGKIIYFESGHLYTILGTLTIQGAQGNHITLASSIPGEGNEFRIYINAVRNANGDPRVEYITVNDSIALGPVLPIQAASGTIFKTNAAGWDADYYWVGGTGNWSEFATHWATTSGGAVFYGAVPGGADAVIFDANSGGGTVTVDVAVFWVNTFSMQAGNTTNVTLGANLASGGAITVAAGTLDSAAFTVSVLAAGLTVGAAGTIKVGGTTFVGSFVIAAGAPVLIAGSTVEYSRAGDQTINNTLNYSNLATSGSGTKTLGGNTTILSNLVVGAGTTIDPATFKITATGAANTLNLTGTIKADSAAFTDNYSGFETYTINAGSTVDYSRNGAQTITNAFNYSNLTVSGTGTKTFAGNTTVTGTFTDAVNNSILTFNAGSTYTFANIAINGTAGNNITMQSSAAATAWLFNVAQASPTVSFVTVSDSNASGGNQIIATDNCANGGNNTNWNFGGGGSNSNPPVGPNDNEPIYHFPFPDDSPPPVPPGGDGGGDADGDTPDVWSDFPGGDYPPGEYRTTVTVTEGIVFVTPYDNEEGILLKEGEKASQTRKRGEFDRVSSVVIMFIKEQTGSELFGGVSSEVVLKKGSRRLVSKLFTLY